MSSLRVETQLPPFVPCVEPSPASCFQYRFSAQLIKNMSNTGKGLRQGHMCNGLAWRVQICQLDCAALSLIREEDRPCSLLGWTPENLQEAWNAEANGLEEYTMLSSSQPSLTVLVLPLDGTIIIVTATVLNTQYLHGGHLICTTPSLHYFSLHLADGALTSGTCPFHNWEGTELAWRWCLSCLGSCHLWWILLCCHVNVFPDLACSRMV